MGLELTALFYCFMAPISAVTSAYALIFLVSRTRLSRNLGIISIAFVSVTFLTPMILNSWQLRPSWLLFGLCLIPGVLGIACNRGQIRIPPGHCKTCGYDLTGNVSGKCSECGAPVPAP